MAGHHVPPGMLAIPPPLTGLAASPSVKASLVRQCLGGSKPTIVVNNAMEQQPEDAELNSRAVPPTRDVARAAKHARRLQRGGSMSDGNRVDLLVRAQLVQRQFVLLYKPGYLLVLSSLWALERARTEELYCACHVCQPRLLSKICTSTFPRVTRMVHIKVQTPVRLAVFGARMPAVATEDHNIARI